jgi:hypothetical protein
MRHQRKSEVVARESIKELKVLQLPAACAGRFKRDAGAARRVMRQVNLMRRRIDVANRLFAFDVDAARNSSYLR